MRWLSVLLRNFLSYSDLELDLADIDMAAVVGHNGSGKSSLAIDSLLFALWGEGRGRTLDKFIRDGYDDTSVTVTFESNGEQYSVTRTVYRNGRGNNLSFLKGDADALEGQTNKAQHTMAEVQTEINRVIGLDHDSITAGPVMIQNDSANFMSQGPSKGMELLIKFFGADQYEPVGKEAGTRSAAYARDAVEAQTQVNRILDVVAEEDDARLALARARHDHTTAAHEREQLVSKVATLQERQSTLREQSQHADTLRQTVKSLVQRIESDTKEHGRLLKQLSDAHTQKDAPEPTFDDLDNVSDAALSKLEERHTKLQDSRTKGLVLSNKLPLLEKQLSDMQARAAIVETVPCHGEGVFASCRFLVDARKQEEIDELSASIESARSEMADTVDDAAVSEAARLLNGARQIRERARAEEARRSTVLAEWRIKTQTAKQLVTTGQDSLRRLETQMERDRQVLVRAKEQLSKVDMDPMAMSNIETEIQQAKTDIAEREQMIQMVHEPAVRAAQQKVDHIETAKTDLERYRLEEKEKSGLAAVYGVLAKAFHRDGIPTLIVENGVPIIEERANDILSRMPDHYRIRLRTQRENKKGGMSDKLHIVVETNGRERDYEMLSGGEKFRIDFALRVALARVLTNRSGTSIETLIIDEGFGSQDDSGVEAMLESLAAVQDEFGLILVVTHQKPVIERFQTRIEVTREEPDPSTAILVR